MKHTLLLLFLAISLPLHADDASRHTKAKEVVEVLHVDRLVSQIIASVNAQTSAITKRVAPASTTAAQNAAMQTFHDKVLALTESQINWSTLQPAYIDLYARTFTEEELDGILTFYRSPAGKVLLEKSPALTVEAQKITQQKLVDMQPQLNQLVQDFQKSMAAPPPVAKP